jgi:lipoprotein-anchoring transpeptidase ErfK/SrfK
VGVRIVVAAAVLALIAPAAAHAKTPALPAAGHLTQEHLAVRVAPNPKARRLMVLDRFQRDFRPLVVLAIAQRRGPDGRLWYKLSLPIRPNNTTGWVPAAGVEVKTMKRTIVVRRASRRIEVWERGQRLLQAPVAVGKPGAETPLGTFFVTGRFVPSNSFLGVFALATSAYSPLTDWPGGGIVGIHGTSAPNLLGQAVSHGCVRVHNTTAGRLRELAPVGTPIKILAS